MVDEKELKFIELNYNNENQITVLYSLVSGESKDPNMLKFFAPLPRPPLIEEITGFMKFRNGRYKALICGGYCIGVAFFVDNYDIHKGGDLYFSIYDKAVMPNIKTDVPNYYEVILRKVLKNTFRENPIDYIFSERIKDSKYKLEDLNLEDMYNIKISDGSRPVFARGQLNETVLYTISQINNKV